MQLIFIHLSKCSNSEQLNHFKYENFVYSLFYINFFLFFFFSFIDFHPLVNIWYVKSVNWQFSFMYNKMLIKKICTRLLYVSSLFFTTFHHFVFWGSHTTFLHTPSSSARCTPFCGSSERLCWNHFVVALEEYLYLGELIAIKTFFSGPWCKIHRSLGGAKVGHIH